MTKKRSPDVFAAPRASAVAGTPPPTRFGGAVQAKPASAAVKSVPPATRFGPATPGKSVQAYFIYRKKEIEDGDLGILEQCIAQNYPDFLADFQKKSKSKSEFVLTSWLTSKGIKDSVSSMLNTALDDDVSVFTEYEDDIDDRFDDLGGKSDKQKQNVNQIREAIKGYGDAFDKDALMEVFSLAQSFNTQNTFALARRKAGRSDGGDYVFSSKLSISSIKYLRETLVREGADYLYERSKGVSNNFHAEKLIATSLVDKGEDLSEWEIFISQPRCEICAADPVIGRFGGIYEAEKE